MRRTLCRYATAIAFAGMSAVAGAHGIDRAAADPPMRACVTEEFTGPVPCFWDARSRSNDKGSSFAVYPVEDFPGARVVVYGAPRRGACQGMVVDSKGNEVTTFGCLHR